MQIVVHTLEWLMHALVYMLPFLDQPMSDGRFCEPCIAVHTLEWLMYALISVKARMALLCNIAVHTLEWLMYARHFLAVQTSFRIASLCTIAVHILAILVYATHILECHLIMGGWVLMIDRTIATQPKQNPFNNSCWQEINTSNCLHCLAIFISGFHE